MWRLIDKPRTARATKTLATEFATMDTLPDERPLSERRMVVYRRQFNEGLFRPVTWATCYCKDTGQTIRVNGQHTSTLLSSLDVLPEFYVVIERYEAQTLADVAALYATFDSKMQSRNTSDLNMAFASTVPELAGTTRATINLCVTGISYAKWQDNYGDIQAAERAELVVDHADFALWLKAIFEGGETKTRSRHIMRGPVAAAMFLTWSKCRRDATEFWEAVRDETGGQPDDPDRTIARWLRSHAIHSAGGPKKKAGGLPREFLVRSMHAWNAWRRDEKTDLRYYPSAKIPATL